MIDFAKEYWFNVFLFILCSICVFTIITWKKDDDKDKDRDKEE